MRCTDPRTVGYGPDGRRVYRYKDSDKSLASHPAPCGQCLECRLAHASEWALRCYHESKMHEKSCFITLTYSDEHLKSPKLVYEDWQNFMKSLRKTQNAPIGVYPKGEYGGKRKRPHWHAILFGYQPNDLVYYRSNDRGDRIYTSKTLDAIWGKNDPELRPNEIGNVTVESAGYVARYAAKALDHGKNQDDYKPVGRPSSKHAIGKKWIEQNWMHTFAVGHCNLPKGGTAPIPRYYEKWLKEHQPEHWRRYLLGRKTDISERTRIKAEEDQKEIDRVNEKRRLDGKMSFARSRAEARRLITQSKFQTLKTNLE